MDFGLGLVLSFTDNATAGIQSAINSLNSLSTTAENANSSLNQIVSLSAFSNISNQIGSAMTNAGSAIISTFSQAISKITDTGQTLSYAETAFDTLYGEVGKGKEVLSQIQEYAESSIFAFEDMIPVVKMLKANGIDAFETITSTSGKSSQLLMDYASDLAAFNPQMKNAYGTGIQAAMGALNEYIAEGNKKLLKSGASLDITQLLGESVGSSIEERSQQVADLIEQLGMVGMTASMAGTPMQQLSNMGDVLFNTLGKISNMGVYDEFTKIISILADFVFQLEDSGKLDKVAESLGKALTSIMQPLEKVVTWITKLGGALVDLVANNPLVAKLAIIGTALTGVFLILGGVVLKIASAFSGLNVLMLTMGTSFGAIKTTFITGIKSMLGHLIPLTLAIGLMYLAWKNDFAGMRTNLTWFVGQVQNSFNTAKQAVSGSVSDLISTMGNLNVKSNFFDGLTLAFMRLQVLWKALCEGWDDYTLSDDTFQKAKELGILPLIEAIFDLKYRFENFVQGFKEGWQNISNFLAGIIGGIKVALSGTIFDTLLQKITAFVKMLGNNDASSWQTVGRIFAYVSAQILAGYVAFKLFNTAVKFVTGVVKVISGLGKAVASVFKLIVNNPIVLVIAGIVTMIASLIDMWTNGVNKINAGIYAIGAVITAVGLGLMTGNPIIALIALIVAGVVALVMVIKTHWTEILNFLTNVWNTIVSVATSVWNSIKSFFVGLWEGIKSVFTTVVTAISTFLTNAWNTISSVASTVWNGIKNVVQFAIMFIEEIISAFVNIVTLPWQFLWANFGDIITNAWNAIVNFLSGVLNTIKTNLSNAWSAISSVASTVWNGIKSVITSVVSAISSGISTAWNTISSITSSVFSTISSIASSVWNGIKSVISSVASGVKSAVSTAWNGISSVSSSVFSAVSSVASSAWNGIKSNISNAVNSAKSVVTSGWGAMKSTVSSMGSAIASAAGTAFNSVKSKISSAMSSAQSLVSSAISKIKGIFSGTHFSLPSIKLPHFSISGSFSINPPSIPHFSVSWYEQGGIFDKPSVIGVGEHGKEAVMPLENNTGWISNLAGQLVDNISQMIPSNSSASVASTSGASDNTYMTNNNGGNTTDNSTTDNSVTFENGAIQIIAQNSSDEEAEKLAEKVMEYIKRKQQIKAMLSYA